MGTRFVATPEAFASEEYKRRIVSAQAEDTVYLNLFDGGFPSYAPHRVIRNKAVIEWEMAGRPAPGMRPCEKTNVGLIKRGDSTFQVARYYSSLATPQFVGDLDYMPLWCGESCTHVNDIKPAAKVVHDIVNEAEQVIREAYHWLR
jgi:nitronate monooxygenase/enoyl-[acyl-carrier protein] reductase II